MRVILSANFSLDDGRIIIGKMSGDNYPDTREDRGGFEPDEDDPMSLTWDDGTEFSESDWETFGDLMFNFIMDHGSLEDDDDFGDDFDMGSDWDFVGTYDGYDFDV